MKNTISFGLLVISALGFGMTAHAAGNGSRVFGCGDFVFIGDLSGSSWHMQSCHHYSEHDGMMNPTSSHDALDLGECVAQAKGQIASTDYSTELTARDAAGILAVTGTDALGRTLNFTLDLNRGDMDAYGVITPYKLPYYPVTGLAGVKYCSDFTNF